RDGFAAELEAGLRLRRERELRPPHCLVELVAELALHEVDQRLQPFGNRRSLTHPLEHLEVLCRIEERQMMPALEAFVRPARNGQKFGRRREVLRPEAEPWRHEVADDLPIERVAGDRDAVGPENVFGDTAPAPDRWPHAQNREVARAAPEVADE